MVGDQSKVIDWSSFDFFLSSDAFDCVSSQSRRLAVFFITSRLIKLSPLYLKKAEAFHASLAP